jgi:hypothetical protein
VLRLAFGCAAARQPERGAQFGLMAEEVAKVPDLVVRDKEGKPYSVRYDAMTAMLLNEFLKARRQIDAQQKQIDACTKGLQRLSRRLAPTSPSCGRFEMSKPRRK